MSYSYNSFQLNQGFYLFESRSVAFKNGQRPVSVIVQVEDSKFLVVGARGQELRIGGEVDGLDDVVVGEGGLLFAGNRVPDLG